MPLSLDIAMPIALFTVVTVALLLNKRTEGKLMAAVEQKEFKTRDTILLVVFMAIIISAIAYTSYINPGTIFQNVLLLIFLSSYTMLLFTFSYVFSNVTKLKAQILSIGFGIAASITGFASLLTPLQDSFTIYRVIAFFCLAGFCFAVAVFEQLKTTTAKERWYLAAQPPAIFLLLFVFLNILNNPGTVTIWFPFVMDIFGLTFAILIILYLSSLFSWKTVGIFAVLLTIMDIILVFSGPMVQAAQSFTGLGLPVLVFVPNVPLLPAADGAVNFFGYAARGLGLGDFFFAGVLAVQTYNKLGKKIAFAAIIAMTVAFAIWEAFLVDITNVLSPLLGHQLLGFPGTVMIISGWIPIVAWAMLTHRGLKAAEQPAPQQTPPPTETPLENPSENKIDKATDA
jgi:hypothetical protein